VTDAKGATIIEAAFITPLLLLLTFAIFEFGAFFYTYLTLETGVSQATRFAVTGNQLSDPDDPGSLLTREASIKLAMRRAAPTLTIEDGMFSFSHMPLDGTVWLGGIGDANELVRVSVNYNFEFFTPLIRPFFPDGGFSITVQSMMKNEGFE
jgi:hypothetical protein